MHLNLVSVTISLRKPSKQLRVYSLSSILMVVWAFVCIYHILTEIPIQIHIKTSIAYYIAVDSNCMSFVAFIFVHLDMNECDVWDYVMYVFKCLGTAECVLRNYYIFCVRLYVKQRHGMHT